MKSQTNPQLIEWLLENGGPVVRWRTATELCAELPDMETKELVNDLTGYQPVNAWLQRLSLGELAGRLAQLDESQLGRLGGMVHGGPDHCLENVLGKLAEFGVCCGMPVKSESALELDQRMLPLMQIFQLHSHWQHDSLFRNAGENLVKSVFAWGLLRAAYPPDAAMSAYLRQHLEDVHKIARDQVYDIYADETELAGLPKAWVGKPVIKQEVMENYLLPWIHDLYVFANYPIELVDDQVVRMIEDIVAYVLDPRFQALHEGYGYAWIKTRNTCYGWGWSSHLPGFDGFDFKRAFHAGMLVQRMELMAQFPQARQSAWFKSCMEHLDGFLTEKGTYRLPGSYLRESEGYYVSGYHMGLGENRRQRIGLEIESTFRILKLRSYCHA